jgi:protein TonB
MALALNPNGSGIPGLDNAPRKPSKVLVIGIAVSAAAHVALIGYLAYQKWVEPLPVMQPDPGIQILPFTPTPKPPPPPPTSDKPPPNQMKLHTPLPTAIPSPDPLPIKPLDIPDGPPAPGPVLLPTVPASPPATPSPPTKVITRANWLKLPSADDMARYYPESAQRRGLSGSATLSCVGGGQRHGPRLYGRVGDPGSTKASAARP